MNDPARLMITVIVIGVVLSSVGRLTADDHSRPTSLALVPHPTSGSEARSRAVLLYELTHGSLHVMHRDFFDEDRSRSIPSASLVDAFKEMEKQFGVKMKWLTVNTDVVNVDHQAVTDFEHTAVKALAAGKPYAEHFTTDRYQYAGAIRLGSQCLKCHVKMRTSNQDRVAGLVITIPMTSDASQPAGGGNR